MRRARQGCRAKCRHARDPFRNDECKVAYAASVICNRLSRVVSAGPPLNDEDTTRMRQYSEEKVQDLTDRVFLLRARFDEGKVMLQRI